MLLSVPTIIRKMYITNSAYGQRSFLLEESRSIQLKKRGKNFLLWTDSVCECHLQSSFLLWTLLVGLSLKMFLVIFWAMRCFLPFSRKNESLSMKGNHRYRKHRFNNFDCDNEKWLKRRLWWSGIVWWAIFKKVNSISFLFPFGAPDW